MITIETKTAEANTLLSGIKEEIGDMGRGCEITAPFYLDHSTPLVLVTHVLTAAPVAVDLREGEVITKSLICGRLLDAHNRTIELLLETMEQLRRIEQESRNDDR